MATVAAPFVVRPFVQSDLPARTGRTMDFIFRRSNGTEYTKQVIVWDGYKGDKGDGLRIKGSVLTSDELSLIQGSELGDCWLITEEGLVASWNGEEWLTTRIVGPQGEKGDTGNGIEKIEDNVTVFPQEIDEDGNILIRGGEDHVLTFYTTDGDKWVSEYSVVNGIDGISVFSTIQEKSAVISALTTDFEMDEEIFNLFVNGVQQPRGTVWEQSGSTVSINGYLLKDDIVSIVFNEIKKEL